MPISFVLIGEGDEEDMITLNMVSKNWKQLDFVKYYARKGYKDYIVLLEKLEKYKGITLRAMVGIMAENNGKSAIHRSNMGTRAMGSLARGEFCIKDIDKVERILDFIMKIKEVPSLNKVWNNTNFGIAISRLFGCDNFDPEIMYVKYSKHHGLVSVFSNTNDYVKMMEDIYNYQRRTARVEFKDALR